MWVMTSKKIKGTADKPPHTIFCIGAVPIATITMFKPRKHDPWFFSLELGGIIYSPASSFGDAMRKMHEELNAPSPEGYK